MAEKIYGLTETDLRVLKEMVADWRHRRGNPSGRPRTDLDDGGPAPEVYVARVPSGGIPGLLESPAEPGSALCDIYRLVPQGQVVGTGSGTGSGSPYDAALQSVVGFQKRVYNLSPSDIGGDQYVLVTRDKYGFWYLPQSAAESPFIGGRFKASASQSFTADGVSNLITSWSTLDTTSFNTTGYGWNSTHQCFVIGRPGVHLFGLNVIISGGAGAGVRRVILTSANEANIGLAEVQLTNQAATTEVQMPPCIGMYEWTENQINNTPGSPAGTGVRIKPFVMATGGGTPAVTSRAFSAPVFWIRWIGYR